MLATVSGTMLVPGVSKNGRLYTPQAIEKAVQRMQDRLADDTARPIVMRTHHDAGDDTTRIAGHLTAVTLDGQGAARYEAVLNDSDAARSVLATAGGDTRSLRNVSIYGWWNDKPKTVRHDGQAVETADDLEVDAVDFTAFPGVPGARIDTVTPARKKAGESATSRHVITESVDAQLSIVDEAAGGTFAGRFARGGVVLDEAAEPMGKRTAGLKGSGGPYADPGYQKDKKQRYQLDTKAHAKAAWSYINKTANQKPYNATQLKAIKGRIRAALKKFGVDVTTKENTVHPAKLLGETTLGECMCCDTDDRAGFSISANNGPIHVNISAWDGIDPAELEVITQAAMQAACDALKALDPDMDADVDIDGAPKADTDGDGESKDDSMESGLPPVTVTPKQMADHLARLKAKAAESATAPQTPAPTKAGPTIKEAVVTDGTQAVAPAATTETAAPARTLTDADIAALAEAFKAAIPTQTPAAAPAATATPETPAPPAAEKTAETAPTAPIAEQNDPKAIATEAQKAVQAAVRESIPEILEQFGLPRRKGVRLTESAPDAPASPEQLWDQRGQVWNQFLPGGTPAAPTAPPAAS